MERPDAPERSAHQHDWWWIFDPRLNLSARAALVFGGSVVAFTIVFAGLAATIMRRETERQVGANLETLAFQLSDKLDRIIYERYRELQLAASLVPFRTRDVPPTERRRLLDAVQSSAREFAWMGFADASGMITASTQSLFEGTPVDARPWFLIGRERPYAGQLIEQPALARALTRRDDDRATRYLDLAVPVRAENGQFLGVLGAHLSWDWTRDLQTSILTETMRRERINATVYSGNGDVLLDSGSSGSTQPPDAPAIADPRRFRGALVEATRTGETFLTGFARSRGHREYRGLGWVIAVRQPLDLALAPARELQQRIVGWGIVFAITMILASWFAAAKFARRLRAIGTAANRIREGDVLTVLPRPPGEGEMAQMCGALGDLVEDLRAKQATLAAENARLAEQARERKSEISS
jgi:hypothetical protein